MLGSCGRAQASSKSVADVAAREMDFLGCEGQPLSLVSIYQCDYIFGIDEHAELCFSPDAKNVPIPGLSGNIDCCLWNRLSQFLDNFRRQFIFALEKTMLGKPGENSQFAMPSGGVFRSRLGDFRAIGERKYADEAGGMLLKVARRGASSISHSEGDLDSLRNPKGSQRQFWIDVRAQLADANVRYNAKSDEQSNSLKDPDYDGSDANFQYVLIRRALLLVGSIISGFTLCLWGAFNNKGMLFSAWCFIASCVLAAAGWALYGATLFPSTWSWWL